MTVSERLVVPLGERSYPIFVETGGLEGLGNALGQRFSPGNALIVTNPVVAKLYLDAAVASLTSAGFVPRSILVADGEVHKTVPTWSRLVDDLLAAGVERGTPIVALGGGVTGDLVGFAAATVLRGVPFVQVPTTLLAMVDAAVGGKTGVNTASGKNLVGAFHQPNLVFATTDVLGTLPPEEWRCGMGEALKHGVIRDAGLVSWMLEHSAELGAREPGPTAWLVRRCCEIKAAVVAADEREAGVRAILNFGHTVGHAIETALGHGAIRHGEAVALGMLVECRFAVKQGWCTDPDLPRRLRDHLGAHGLPMDLGPWRTACAEDLFRERLEAAMRMDKKTVRGRLNLVAPVALGEVRLVAAPAHAPLALLEMILSWENEP